MRLVRALTAACLTVAASLATVTMTAAPAHADGCYTWTRNLASGSSGNDVRELQIRLSGYPGYGAVLAIDGAFGAGTRSALIRFQQAWGLAADGVAGPQTYNRIYAMQDNDCTTVNFTYGEFNKCNSDWSGGAVSAATAKANARLNMWKLEAMRHALGDVPLYLSSGFRSYSCNAAVGGAAGSRHLYGDAIDLVGSPSFCRIVQQARYHGFREILGPGYTGHSDHAHVANRSGQFWSASSCGI
jgi:zinc D-Ala-D-Ala carboxypeptidase